MSPFERALHWIQVAAAVAVLAGLVRHKYVSRAVFFPLYLLSVGIPLALFAASDRFWTPGIWIAKEALQAALKVGLAIELSSRIFGAFPRALSTSRISTLGFLFLVLWVVASSQPGPTAFVTRILPVLSFGTVWLFATTLGLALWHLIPLDPLHKAILLALVPYLLLFSALGATLDAVGWEVRAAVSYLNSAVYLGVLVYWAVVASRPDSVALEDGFVLARLQPWRG
jgi:hypothetical protein